MFARQRGDLWVYTRCVFRHDVFRESGSTRDMKEYDLEPNGQTSGSATNLDSDWAFSGCCLNPWGP